MVRLTPPTMQAAYRHRESEGLSDYSVHQAHRILRRALTQAFAWGQIPRNQAALVFPPRPQRRTMTALTVDELGQVLVHTRSERLHALWVLFGTTGLRLGEADLGI